MIWNLGVIAASGRAGAPVWHKQPPIFAQPDRSAALRHHGAVVVD